MAVANYHDVHGHLPPPFVRGPDGRPWHSWRVLVLPYIEQGRLHDRYKFDEPWDGPNNRLLASEMPRLYRFHHGVPDDTTVSNYLAVVGPETAWHPTEKVKFADMLDGVSKTILIVENAGAGVHWLEPRDLPFADFDYRLNTPGGIGSPHTRPGVALADGSLRMLGPEVTPDVLRALLTVRGGEPLADTGTGWELLPDGRDRPLRER